MENGERRMEMEIEQRGTGVWMSTPARHPSNTSARLFLRAPRGYRYQREIDR